MQECQKLQHGELSSQLVTVDNCFDDKVPLDLLDGCTALKELSLELVTFPKEEMGLFLSGSWTPIILRKKKTEIRSLRLTLSDPLFHFFSLWITSSACNLDVTKLERFAASMTMEYYDQGHINRILQACSATVEIFCFCPTFQKNLDSGSTAINAIDISNLASLRILRLRVGVLAGALWRLNLHARQSYLPWIIQLISQLPSTSCITEISVKVSLFKERELAGIRGTVDMEIWHSLDTLLAPHAANSLRRFRLIVLEEEFEFDFPDDVTRDIRRSFPKLEGANALSVELTNAITGFLSVPEHADILERVKIY